MADKLSVDYGAVLADLRIKRKRLDAAIRAIEAVVRHQDAHGERGSGREATKNSAPEQASFQGLSILDASRKVLENKGQCQRTKDILRALQQGGIALTGKSPINNVGAVLNTNLKTGGGIVRVKRGLWSLASWQSQQQADAAVGAEPLGALRSVPARMKVVPVNGSRVGEPVASMPTSSKAAELAAHG